MRLVGLTGGARRVVPVDETPGARRVVRMNVPDPGLPSNIIVNTRYTMLNFIPKNFGEQFGQHVNRYFL